MTKDVFVIIPVYNVEKYIRCCVDSVLKQSYKNIKVILVDDGSPDACPKICDEYARLDSRVIVIHQNNSGLSSARGTGLAYIENSGLSSDNVYVGFLDSDDWIAVDTIEYSVGLLDKYDADIVQFQIQETKDEEQKIKQPKEMSIVCNGRNEILQFYMCSTTTGKSGDYSVCQCLFPLGAIRGERFRIGKINEDIDFKYRVLSKCTRLVVTNQLKYFYRQGNVTTSMGGLKKKDFDLYEAGDVLAELTSHETYGDIAFLGKVKQARTPLSLLCKIAYFGVADSSICKDEVINKLMKEHRNNVGILLKAPIPLSRKVLTLLFAINYKLAKTCIKLVK